MINRISNGSELARAAMQAALKSQAQALRNVEDQAASLGASQGSTGGLGSVSSALSSLQSTSAASSPIDGASFVDTLKSGLQEVNAQVSNTDRLVEDVLAGKVTEFHEIAAQLKQSDLSLRFALEVRNKFVDAYREVMRMSI
ncbi:MAG: flagellar hook-basal body complex protein FliE [Planctomycetes bacterium]|jgi:flagellar hook-basal body complex protein FliE|nr:flagellar hook-basal body complex protein FliE [Planctomycetota bacterium]